MTARIANRWDPSVPAWAIPRILKLIGGAIRKCDWCRNWYKQGFVGNPRKYCCDAHRKDWNGAVSYGPPDVGEGPSFEWSWSRFFFLNSGLLCESTTNWRTVTLETDDDGKRWIKGFWRGYQNRVALQTKKKEVSPDFSPWWGTRATIVRFRKETQGAPVRFRGCYLFLSGVHRKPDVSWIRGLHKRGQGKARLLPVHIDPEYVWRKNPYGGWIEIKRENAEYLDMREKASNDATGGAAEASPVEPVPSATWSEAPVIGKVYEQTILPGLPATPAPVPSTARSGDIGPCAVHKCLEPRIDNWNRCELHKDWQICPTCINWRWSDYHHCPTCHGKTWCPPGVARASAAVRIPRYEKRIEGVTVFSGEGEGCNDDIP